MNSAVIFGGYGTFGGLVARELVRTGVSVLIVGRNARRAGSCAAGLGALARAAAGDATSAAACRSLLAGSPVAVNCAGPFSSLGTTLLDACLEAGSHYVDIADDRRYVASVRGLGPEFARRDLAAAYGCSSLPAISGALGLVAADGGGKRPERARVTLFIGNQNRKGPAAVRSAARSLGCPIDAPQGVLRGFHGRELVPLPPPYGPRPAYNLESPDYDLLPELLGVQSVVVKVGFEQPLVGSALAALARIRAGSRPWWGSLLARAARWAPRSGSSGGAVMTEVFHGDGSVCRAALVAREEGQRLAALPCAWVAGALCRGGVDRRGALMAHDVLGAAALVERLAAEGYELHVETGQDPARGPHPP